MHPAIEHVTNHYLRAADGILPGFVQALYLTGSAALGAWQPAHSDVDAVVVTSRTADADDLAALATVHAGMPRPPHFDCVYLDPAAFAGRAADCRVTPFVVAGEFHTDAPCGDLHPVLWLTLGYYGLRVRGPVVADLNIAVEPAALRRFNLDNLHTYWQPLAKRLRRYAAGRADDDPVDAEIVVWTVLGPARLHYTLAHADVISKARAGAYLGQLFPHYATLTHRAVRWRAGAPESFTAADLRAAAESVEVVADNAWRRWGRPRPGR